MCQDGEAVAPRWRRVANLFLCRKSLREDKWACIGPFANDALDVIIRGSASLLLDLTVGGTTLRFCNL